jgi:hypothetical protein
MVVNRFMFPSMDHEEARTAEEESALSLSSTVQSHERLDRIALEMQISCTSSHTPNDEW